MKRIVLVCANGMSTSLLVTKMKAAAEKNGDDVTIKAVGETKFDQCADETDILLLGPQVKYLFDDMKEQYEPRGIKVSVINTVDYGCMNGEKVLKQALAM